LNIFHAADPKLPDFKTILDELLEASWYEERRTALAGAIQRIKSDQLLNRLMALAIDTRADTQIRAQAFLTIKSLDYWLSLKSPKNVKLDNEWTAFYTLARQSIATMMNDPYRMPPGQLQLVPPGSPIGN
jgi:hypothetical protein